MENEQVAIFVAIWKCFILIGWLLFTIC